MDELAKGGDRDAMYIMAGFLDSDDADLAAKAERYALTLAVEGSQDHLRTLVEKAVRDQSNDSVNTLRCAVRPELDAVQLVSAYELASQTGLLESDGMVVATLLLAFTGQPEPIPPAEMEAKWASLSARFDIEALWLRPQQTLLGPCPEGESE